MILEKKDVMYRPLEIQGCFCGSSPIFSRLPNWGLGFRVCKMDLPKMSPSYSAELMGIWCLFRPCGSVRGCVGCQDQARSDISFLLGTQLGPQTLNFLILLLYVPNR